MSAPRPPKTIEDGPFVLRSLLQGVPLSAEGDEQNVKINCVELSGTCSSRKYIAWNAKASTAMSISLYLVLCLNSHS